MEGKSGDPHSQMRAICKSFLALPTHHQATHGKMYITRLQNLISLGPHAGETNGQRKVDDEEEEGGNTSNIIEWVKEGTPKKMVEVTRPLRMNIFTPNLTWSNAETLDKVQEYIVLETSNFLSSLNSLSPKNFFPEEEQMSRVYNRKLKTKELIGENPTPMRVALVFLLQDKYSEVAGLRKRGEIIREFLRTKNDYSKIAAGELSKGYVKKVYRSYTNATKRWDPLGIMGELQKAISDLRYTRKLVSRSEEYHRVLPFIFGQSPLNTSYLEGVSFEDSITTGGELLESMIFAPDSTGDDKMFVGKLLVLAEVLIRNSL